MAENDEPSLRVLEAEIKAIGQSVHQHDKVLLGNGREGLIQTVSRLEGAVNGIQRVVSRIEDSFQNVAQASYRMEEHSKGMALSVAEVQDRVESLKKSIKPIIEWKRAIYIRLGTVGMTATFIFCTLWWVYENTDKLAKLLGR